MRAIPHTCTLNQPERQGIHVIVNMLRQQIDGGFYRPHFRQSFLQGLVDEIFASRWRQRRIAVNDAVQFAGEMNEIAIEVRIDGLEITILKTMSILRRTGSKGRELG